MIQAGTIRIGSGRTVLGRRRVLDELDQPVAIDHLAGRDRDVAADLERLGADGLLAAGTTRSQSSMKLRKPSTRFWPPMLDGVRCSTSGLVSEEIRRRDHVEHLPRRRTRPRSRAAS